MPEEPVLLSDLLEWVQRPVDLVLPDGKSLVPKDSLRAHVPHRGALWWWCFQSFGILSSASGVFKISKLSSSHRFSDRGDR